jgi:trans-aconitate methyltransferase
VSARPYGDLTVPRILATMDSTATMSPCSQAAFEQRYRQTPDPWGFRTAAYERDKYETTIAALSKERYRRAFEPGCSVGELTARLAARCDAVRATDFSPSAVMEARSYCKALPNVTVDEADIAKDTTKGPFDLIVFSEIGYYFPKRQLSGIARRLAAELERDGEFVAVHWLGLSDDHEMHGDEVHSVLAAALPLEWIKGERRPGFRLDIWMRR